MANIIKIKRSTSVATPASLSQGELAYSESDGGSTGSGNLFIGTANGLVKIGGNTDVATLAGLKIFQSITGDSGTATADTQTDTIAITGGTGISTVASDGPEGLIITNDSPNVDQNLFSTHTVTDTDSGYTWAETGSVAAGSTTDTLTWVSGTGIDLDVDATSGAIKIINTSPGGTQDIWLTVAGDTGSTDASAVDTTLTFTGGTGITTAMSGDVLTITNDSPNVTQNLWLTFTGDTGTINANTATDSFDFAGGTGITTAVSGDAVTITNDAPNVDQNIWATFTGDAGTSTADSTTDSFDFNGGTGITTLVTDNVVTITNSSPNVDQNLYATFTADSGTPSTANSTTDTMTIAGGTSITTAVTADTITVNGTPLIDSDTMAGALSTNVASSESLVAYIETEISNAVTNGMTYKGSFDPTASAGDGNPNINTITSETGDTYTVTVAGTYNWDTGSAVLEVGDVLIAEADGVLNDVAQWTVVNKNLPELNFVKTYVSDSGSFIADQIDDTMNIVGGSGISTSVATDTLTIVNDSPNVDQNIWFTFTGDSGTINANTTSDSFDFTGGTGITTAVSGDAVTITNDSPHIATNLSVGTVTATNVPINSSTGSDIATLPAATATLAGIVVNGAQAFGGTKTFFGLTGSEAAVASVIDNFTIDCGTFT
jgi:hypothetical protein